MRIPAGFLILTIRLIDAKVSAHCRERVEGAFMAVQKTGFAGPAVKGREAPFDRELARYFDGLEAIQDPFPLYDRLLREAPVCLWRDDTVVLSKHRLVKEAFRDTERFPAREVRSRPRNSGEERLSRQDRALLQDIYSFERNTVSRMNGERHVRVRGAAHRYFTPGRVDQMRSSMQQILDDLLEPLPRTEVVDLMPLAYHLPLLMITDLLGVPREDAEQVKRWGDAINHHDVSNPDRPEALRAAQRAITEQSAYVRELVERQRREPAASALVAGVLDAADGDRLAEEELVAFYVHTLFAGHETTQHMVGNGIRAFMLHRDQWERLCGDLDLAGGAVEEVLRWDSPVHVIVKTTPADLELEGVNIPEGARVVNLIGAANRDPEVFENPSGFDIARDPNDHLALAFGPHFCLGASLARLEGQVVFSTLAGRFPKLELAVDPGELRFHRGLRGLDDLPVRLGPRD
jgi:cytochrome P450